VFSQFTHCTTKIIDQTAMTTVATIPNTAVQ